MLRDVNGQSLTTMSFHLPLNYKKNKSMRKRDTFIHSQTEIQTVIQTDGSGELGCPGKIGRGQIDKHVQKQRTDRAHDHMEKEPREALCT